MDMGVINPLPPEAKLVVSQAHSLAKSVQEMTLVEKRILMICMAVIRQNDETFAPVSVAVTDYAKLYENKGNSVHRHLSAAVGRLAKRNVLINYENDESFHSYNWVKSAHYITGRKSDTGVAYFRISLNDELKPFLLNLERSYQSYGLPITKRIKSVDSIRLFEIFQADTLNFKRKSVYYGLDDLRMRLASSLSWRDFKRGVLDRAVTDLETKSGISWSYETRKSGKKIVGLQVTIHKKDPAVAMSALQDDEDILIKLEVENGLKNIGFTEPLASFFEEIGPKGVRDVWKSCVEEQKARENTHNPIRNLPAYIHHRLKNTLTLDEVRSDAAETSIDVRAVAETLDEQFLKAKEAAVEQAIADLSEAQLAKLESYIQEHMSAFERNLQDDKRGMFKGVRRRHAVEGGFVTLDSKLESARTYYAAKDFGYDDATNQAVFDLLPE